MISIGLIADCQYADIDTQNLRFYRSGPKKLSAAISAFNQQELAFVVHLGDFIDRDWRSFQTLAPISAQSKAPFYHVLGNHDFWVDDSLKNQVPSALNLEQPYYSIQQYGWRFLFVDGNEISLYRWPKDSAEHQASLDNYQKYHDGKPHWNGAIGEQQLRWIESHLSEAAEQNQKVIIFSHFPLFPGERHNLWNAEQVIERLTLNNPYPAFKAWINGHHHAGHYQMHNGVHFLTLKAMLDTEENAYSVAHLYDDRIEIQGYGRQESQTLRY